MTTTKIKTFVRLEFVLLIDVHDDDNDCLHLSEWFDYIYSLIQFKGLFLFLFSVSVSVAVSN